ncbi:hypothetical protein Anas_07838 [Armadillidium nasatum]|uniref:Uncharacterized protein n=1 Tax=Armadillidium nasatum TaxID=96803 RepID=A0A5N5TDL0_9CRUS|nr:hypothetical protein Anas_07838 [Armadillidium nasatum]
MMMNPVDLEAFRATDISYLFSSCEDHPAFAISIFFSYYTDFTYFGYFGRFWSGTFNHEVSDPEELSSDLNGNAGHKPISRKMKLDDGVDTEDSFAVATSSAAMPKLENPEDVCHYIQKTRETFPNFFEHATICNFAEERPLNIAQILT